MKLKKYIIPFVLLICIAAGCKKDQQFNDTSLVGTAASASSLGVMFDITHDNTGVVTITPSGTGAVSYDIYYGDASTTPGKVAAGRNITHTYAEGNYSVKLVAHDIKGGTTTLTQPLVVSYRAPINLAATVSTLNLSVSVSATATYATFFKIYFGDSTSVKPEPYANALAGQTITHNYANAGTYVVSVVALSGGAETTTYLDTIKVGKQIDLPVTFDDPQYSYSISDFAGAVSTLVADPTNAGNHVIKTIKTAGAATYAGSTIGTALGFANPIPLSNANARMQVSVYSPAPGIHVRFKVEDHTNAGKSVETEALTTVANQWEVLIFDFTKQAAGTAAFDPSTTYDKATIFFDFNNPGTGSTFYFDNIQMAPPPLKQINLPVTFDDPAVDYTVTDFAGNSSTLVVDPTNSANHVMQSIKTTGALIYAGTTIGTSSGFSSLIPISSSNLKMTVSVYSPAAGIDVKLKLDDHTRANSGFSVETDTKTTVANQWETLTFDFSMPAANTPAFNAANKYDLATIFFDFGNTGTGSKFYFDNVQMAPASGGGGGGGGLPPGSLVVPVTFEDPLVTYTLTDFGGNQSSVVADPTNAANHVGKAIKTSGAQTWAGTTIGTAAGFAAPVPLTALRSKMTVRVFSPAIGIHVRLKMEDHNDGTHSVETEAVSTVANQWETLTFDFNNQAAGTAMLNPTYNFDKASIFFDFNNPGTGSTFYFDDIIFL